MLRGYSWRCFLRSPQSCFPAAITWGENVLLVRLNWCLLSFHLFISCLAKSLLQVFLKSDDLCLMKEKNMGKKRPTLPSVHILAMHVQQLEIGGFTLATGAYKWNKLRWDAAQSLGRWAWSRCLPCCCQLWFFLQQAKWTKSTIQLITWNESFHLDFRRPWTPPHR